ncbi:uncharacterized protein [Pyxicephalus adspersus]|uniref:uncharacterized protein isoform X1 n=1 Tax=Pyxicephalus adspersus TaxID=30357 RepID=UPI003B59E128
MQNIFSVCSMPYRMCLLVALFLSLLAITVSGYQVKCQNTSLPVLGEDVTLTCEFQAHQDVLQVTWQKKRGENTQNMATYSEIYGTNIVKLFENHVSLINASSRNSTIKIFKLKTEDEACYVCLFNVYPNGAIKGEVCLTDLRKSVKKPTSKPRSHKNSGCEGAQHRWFQYGRPRNAKEKAATFPGRDFNGHYWNNDGADGDGLGDSAQLRSTSKEDPNSSSRKKNKESIPGFPISTRNLQFETPTSVTNQQF